MGFGVKGNLCRVESDRLGWGQRRLHTTRAAIQADPDAESESRASRTCLRSSWAVFLTSCICLRTRVPAALLTSSLADVVFNGTDEVFELFVGLEHCGLLEDYAGLAA